MLKSKDRWCIEITLAPVCKSMTPVTGPESSPELWNMTSVGPGSRVIGKSTKGGNSAERRPCITGWDHGWC